MLSVTLFVVHYNWYFSSSCVFTHQAVKIEISSTRKFPVLIYVLLDYVSYILKRHY